MPQDIKDIIRSPAKHVFRRLYIKRVLLTGGYEADWFEITPYVISWGKIQESYGDNLYTGEYEIDSLQIELDNTKARFNPEADSNSLFFGFQTRIGTRVRMEIGFYDIDQEEVLGRSFYGISFSEPKISSDGVIKYDVASVFKVFQLFPAKGIAEQNKFTHEHISRWCQKLQNGVRIFDRYFEGPDDATRYQISLGLEKFLAEILEEETVWDKIKMYSLYENYFPSMTNDGNFQWTNRDASLLSQWTFNGAGSFDNEYAINIIDIAQELGVDRVFTKVVIRYDSGNTDISTAEINWTPGDGSPADIYGVRVFEYSGTPGEINSPTAQNVADRILAATQTPRNIYNIKTTLIPHLRLNDRVTLNYSGTVIQGDAFILGTSSLGGPDRLGGPLGAINLTNKICKISALSVDLDSFECEFELTEL